MRKNRQIIKDFHYKIIGYIYTESDGKLTARDALLRIVGTYDPKLDVTKDFYGRIVGRGNTLSTLFNFFDR